MLGKLFFLRGINAGIVNLNIPNAKKKKTRLAIKASPSKEVESPTVGLIVKK